MCFVKVADTKHSKAFTLDSLVTKTKLMPRDVDLIDKKIFYLKTVSPNRTLGQRRAKDEFTFVIKIIMFVL